MRLIITIDLEDRDMPLYEARITHALSGLLHDAHNHNVDGEHVYVYPAGDFDRTPASKTVVTVTQSDDER